MPNLRVTCLRCQTSIDCPESDAGKRVLCQHCLQPIQVPAVLSVDSMLIDASKVDHARAARNDFFAPDLSVGRQLSCSETTPAAKPTQAKDPDKALTNVALGLFRLNNWPCEEEDGYKSFKLTVKFRSPNRGLMSTDVYRVRAENGLLIIESMILDLPELPGVPLLEMLNEINQRAVSSVFELSPEGIVMRHTMIPRTREEGYFSARMILQTIRQMFHDRTHALSLLRQVVETKAIEPLGIASAFAQPIAPCPVPSFNQSQLADIVGFAGFHALNDGKHVLVSRQIKVADRDSVRLVACPGYICGWMSMGNASRGQYAWTHFPKKLRNLFAKGSTSSGKLNQLYEHLNTLNHDARLLRFTAARGEIMAMATLFPTDLPPTVDQFKVFADSLLTFSETGTQTPSSALLSKVS
jgi:hypothetical protein